MESVDKKLSVSVRVAVLSVVFLFSRKFIGPQNSP
ncbi:MAG: hypothetical protein QG657_3890, partial [Acidobacteriota bacterium]|nr:hypothetical protein [Acidobacteriota bacterium]